jgi:hypothetical protein
MSEFVQFAKTRYHQIFLFLALVLLISSTAYSNQQEDPKLKTAANLNIAGLTFLGIFLMHYLTSN